MLFSFLPPGGKNVHFEGECLLKSTKKNVGVVEITSGAVWGHSSGEWKLKTAKNVVKSEYKFKETPISSYCLRFISTSFCTCRHLCNGFADRVLQLLTASPLNRAVVVW